MTLCILEQDQLCKGQDQYILFIKKKDGLTVLVEEVNALKSINLQYSAFFESCENISKASHSRALGCPLLTLPSHER